MPAPRRRGNLRAHVRVLPFKSPAADAMYTWRLFLPEVTPSVELWDEGMLIIARGAQQTLAAAMDEAHAAVIAELDRRIANINDSDNQVADCPNCGDPSEYEEDVWPGGGIVGTYRCDSCGHPETVSA